VKIIILILLKYYFDVNLLDNDGNSSLYISFLKGHLDIVKVLIGNGADVNLQNYSRNSPFHISCLYNRIDVDNIEDEDNNISDNDNNFDNMTIEDIERDKNISST
jgi:ankyrin repeat protein